MLPRLELIVNDDRAIRTHIQYVLLAIEMVLTSTGITEYGVDNQETYQFDLSGIHLTLPITTLWRTTMTDPAIGTATICVINY